MLLTSLTVPEWRNPMTPVCALEPPADPQLRTLLFHTVVTIGSWGIDTPGGSVIWKSRHISPEEELGSTLWSPALMMRLFVAQLFPTVPRPKRIASFSWLTITLS